MKYFTKLEKIINFLVSKANILSHYFNHDKNFYKQSLLTISKMQTKAWAIALMVFCTAFTSFAQVFYKLGANKLGFNIISLITNLPLITGMFLYILGAVIMIVALKGGEVSVLYPIIATSYIWVSILSIYFFNENLNLFRWIGIFIIIVGIILISTGSKQKETIKYTEAI